MGNLCSNDWAGWVKPRAFFKSIRVICSSAFDCTEWQIPGLDKINRSDIKWDAWLIALWVLCESEVSVSSVNKGLWKNDQLSSRKLMNIFDGNSMKILFRFPPSNSHVTWSSSVYYFSARKIATIMKLLMGHGNYDKYQKKIHSRTKKSFSEC